MPLLHDPETGLHHYDPSWPPDLPPGAVRGDITRQVFCCDVPRFYYRDITRTCTKCDSEFVFAAAEQNYWYGTLQFHLSSTAIRCAPCRKRRRSLRAIRTRLSEAAAAASVAPDVAVKLLDHAAALTAHIERLNKGDTSKVVAAARKAGRLERDWPEPLYWEARGQELMGRPEKAAPLLRHFIAHSPRAPEALQTLRTKSLTASRRLVKDAEERLAALSS